MAASCHGARGRSPSGGFTLLELMIAMSIVAIAMLALMSTLFQTSRLQATIREQTLAYNGARLKIEELRNIPFSTIYNLYKQGTTLNTFTVSGLNVASGTSVGQISFPEDSSGSGSTNLREYVVDSALGMPRDLNGDGIIDTLSHSNDYILLPVKVVITWKGIGGTPTSITLGTLIAEK